MKHIATHYTAAAKMLCATPLFSCFDSENLKSLIEIQRCPVQRYSKGDTVMSGKCGKGLRLILKGSARVIKDGVFMSRLPQGGLFGAATMFAPRERFVTTVMAANELEILYMDSSFITGLLRSSPEFCISYITYLSGRIFYLNDKISAFTGKNAEVRLAKWLSANLKDGKVSVPSLVTLASALDMGRASLYRALSVLEEKELIQKQGKFITVADAAELNRFITSEE